MNPATFTMPVVQPQQSAYREYSNMSMAQPPMIPPNPVYPNPNQTIFIPQRTIYDTQQTHPSQMAQPMQTYYAQQQNQHNQFNAYPAQQPQDPFLYVYQQQPYTPQPTYDKPKERARKILTIVDPKTHETVKLPDVKDKHSSQPTTNASSLNSAAAAEKKKPSNIFLDVVKNLSSSETAQQPVSAKIATATTTATTPVPAQPSIAAKSEIVEKEKVAEVQPKKEEEESKPVIQAEKPKEETKPVKPSAETPVPEAKEDDIKTSSVEVSPQEEQEPIEKAGMIREDTSQSTDTEVVEKTPEEIAKEEAEKANREAEKKKEREQELDKRIAELLQSEEVCVENGVYSRNFLITCRSIEKEFKRTPCPLTEAELTTLGLDINTMIRSERRVTTNFNPAWYQQKQNRPNNAYRGRTTTDGTGRGGPRPDRGAHKKAPPVRPSIERMPRFTLPTSKHAWKPERQRAQENIDEEQAKIKEVCKKVRSLMNKITPTSKEDLIAEFISYNVSSNAEQLKNVVNIIFDKAVDEPKFCALYAEVCKEQVDHEPKQDGKKSLFRDRILTRTQEAFQDKSLEENQAKLAEVEKETDIAKRDKLKAELLDEQLKLRRRKFGNMTFIGHLYRNYLLSTKIVQSCIYELFKSMKDIEFSKKGAELKPINLDEESIHCGLQLIETIGAIIEKSKEQNAQVFLDQWMTRLDNAKNLCSNKIRFYIMNIIELRKNKWIPRKSVETGPKKIEDIHKEIRQEQIENEKARDQYDRRHTGIRASSNSLRKNAPISRNSIERNHNQHPEQKRAAAAATTKLTTSNVQPKNISLSQVNDSSFGKTKKEWHSGASGGGTSVPSNESSQKSAWGRRDSNDQRKRSTVEDRNSSARENSAAPISSRRSTSQNSIAEKDDDNLTEDQQEMRCKLMNVIQSDLNEVLSGDLPQNEMIDELHKLVGVEKYASPPAPAVYEMALRATIEKNFSSTQAVRLAQVLRLSLTDKKKKSDFIDGAIRFCKYAVDIEMWCDFPNIWSTLGEVLVNASHIAEIPEGVEMLGMKDLSPVFLAAKTDVKGKKHALLVEFIKRLAELECKESGKELAEGVAWEFEELEGRAALEKDGLSEELKNCKMSSGKSLSAVLSHD
ncbi:unnamed protein product [Caenorhabditis bovis]|uniref:MIF4G domain-containing protein n=1 Tax=Caenorhabditis bovis TaxID=2654633 RepID=A0A8S1EVE5_9PELO|nr:unnamed protein product [Caenorhabditis bovis]